MQGLLDGSDQLQMIPLELKLKSLYKQEKKGIKHFVDSYLSRGRSFFPELIVKNQSNIQLNPNFTIQKPVGPRIENGNDINLSNNDKFSQLLNYSSYLASLLQLNEKNFKNPAEVLQHDVNGFVKALANPSTGIIGWASKEVGGRSSRIISFFYSMFPNGKVIYLARDPLHVTRSIILERRRRGVELNAKDIWRQLIDSQNVVNYIASHTSDMTHVVAYEMLIENTEHEMKRVCRALQIPYAKIHTIPTTLGLPAVVHTSSRATTQVFKSTKHWSHDLYLKQKIVLFVYQICLRTSYRFLNLPYARYQFTPYKFLFNKIKQASNHFDSIK